MERRRSSSIKLSNLRSIDPDNGPKKKHVVIKTDDMSNESIVETKFTNKLPLLYDHKNVSSQTTLTKRPVSLYLKHDVKGNKYSTRIRSHSIDHTDYNTRDKRKYPSLEKLHKLREKFLQSEVVENPTDDESTPLVSELSSPITISPDEHSSRSLSSSDPLSPCINKSKIKILDRPTNLNLNQRKYKENLANKESTSSQIDLDTFSPNSRPRTYSESTDSSLSFSSNIKLLSASNVSLHSSKGSQSSNNNQLSRQDAVDSLDEHLTDVYCVPTRKT